MGTEKLMYNGTMPMFPGMGYPLVPGYEAVGTVVDAGENATAMVGKTVFVPGSSKFEGARGLFGGQAKTLITGAARVIPLPAELHEKAVLMSLAATAQHAVAGGEMPDLSRRCGKSMTPAWRAQRDIGWSGPRPTSGGITARSTTPAVTTA